MHSVFCLYEYLITLHFTLINSKHAAADIVVLVSPLLAAFSDSDDISVKSASWHGALYIVVFLCWKVS